MHSITACLSSVLDSGAQSDFLLPVVWCYYHYRSVDVTITVRGEYGRGRVRVGLRTSGKTRSIGLFESGEC